MDQTVTFVCDRCDSVLESPLEYAGRIAQCPTCGAKFRVPYLDPRLGVVGYELLDTHDQNPVPIHAYAASGSQAPQILEDESGRWSIVCPRCGGGNAIDADRCDLCGVPFTIDGAPPPPPPSSRGVSRSEIALVLAVISLPLAALFVPAILAMMFALASMGEGRRRGANATASVAILLACGSILGGVLWHFY